MRVNTIKFIIALILGYVLSLITNLVISHGSIIAILLFIALAVLFYKLVNGIVIKYTQSTSLGVLGGILGGLVLSFIATSLIGNFAEAVIDAETTVGLVLGLSPLAIIYAILIYFMAGTLDKK